MEHVLWILAATSSNTELPTSLRVVKIAYGDFGNSEKVSRNWRKETCAQRLQLKRR